MHVVAIPFKNEEPSTVLANLEVAAGHERIDQVWAVGTNQVVAGSLADVAQAFGAELIMVPERRIGHFRPGKGDAMNTALLKAAAEGVKRIHFYDADITNFGRDWIEGAENAADSGFEVVRHTFPRAATDAMITWLVTKPILAIKFPGTVLPRIGQPLGGELLLTRGAIETLAGQDDVIGRSDWGIDTLYTFAAVRAGFSLYEHHVADGKRHALYGSLAELETMLVECFDAAAKLDGAVPDIRHQRDIEAPVPPDLQDEMGYDIAATRPLTQTPWAPGEEALVAGLPGHLALPVASMRRTGDVGFLDERVWEELLLAILGRFRGDEPGWRSLLFRLWVGRVLNYTGTHATKGYEPAMAYLAATITAYERNALHSLA